MSDIDREPGGSPGRPGVRPLGGAAVGRRRAGLLQRLFPEGVPRLWCPPLTHYDQDGAIDRGRCAAHLAFVTRWSRGLLVPGSTGDGWELTAKETREITDLALAEAGRLDAAVLVGALHPDPGDAALIITDTTARLAASGGDGMRPAGAVCGFAVCPPRGARLTQAELGAALSRLLSLDAPLALYQLPQVTENEMSPGLVADLASRFYNFVLFKDTSGADRVATELASGANTVAAVGDVVGGDDRGGVFLVRGAEGDYARHLRPNGGSYDGLLLSTANSFGAELAAIIEHSQAGRRYEAERLSARLSALVTELFSIVESVGVGNPFSNAGKAADHFYAYGPQGLAAPPPRLHAGVVLSREVLIATEDVLRRHDLLPARGYLE